MTHGVRIGQMIAANASQETAMANYPRKIVELKQKMEQLTEVNLEQRSANNASFNRRRIKKI